MSTGFAIDTNIAVYAFTDGPKQERARTVMEDGPFISVQLLNEFANVATRKIGRTWGEVTTALSDIRAVVENVRPIDVAAHETALRLARQYRLSLYDSLILAAALLDGCATFYSEDMQHGMVIDDRMTIINPFLPERNPA